ncbi:hypothetical protein chiPu_0020829 [Chiloscyllium punctatum]|uniref:Uncharacterized protein n=1 Tax=Chiloscyllium punctatum TaxID=137246 RepID=A0A401RK72_CHIPU|nr:hypothetical protein [Chiloscyllium punctatum]
MTYDAKGRSCALLEPRGAAHWQQRLRTEQQEASESVRIRPAPGLQGRIAELGISSIYRGIILRPDPAFPGSAAAKVTLSARLCHRTQGILLFCYDLEPLWI